MVYIFYFFKDPILRSSMWQNYFDNKIHEQFGYCTNQIYIANDIYIYIIKLSVEIKV